MPSKYISFRLFEFGVKDIKIEKENEGAGDIEEEYGVKKRKKDDLHISPITAVSSFLSFLPFERD